MSFQKPTIKVRPKQPHKNTASYFIPDNLRRISFKYMKKQEEKLLGKGKFNVYKYENWLV